MQPEVSAGRRFTILSIEIGVRLVSYDVLLVAKVQWNDSELCSAFSRYVGIVFCFLASSETLLECSI